MTLAACKRAPDAPTVASAAHLWKNAVPLRSEAPILTHSLALVHCQLLEPCVASECTCGVNAGWECTWRATAACAPPRLHPLGARLYFRPRPSASFNLPAGLRSCCKLAQNRPKPHSAFMCFNPFWLSLSMSPSSFLSKSFTVFHFPFIRWARPRSPSYDQKYCYRNNVAWSICVMPVKLHEDYMVITLNWGFRMHLNIMSLYFHAALCCVKCSW